MQNTQQCVCHMPEAWSVEYIRKHWQQLEKEANISFFQSWPWIDAWLTVARKEVRPLVFKINNQVVGLCFVGCGQTKDHRFLSFPTFVPWGTGRDYIDVSAPEYNSPIILPGHEKSVRQAMVSFLLTHPRMSKMNRIDLRRVPIEHYEDYVVEGYHYDIYKLEDSFSVTLDNIRNKDITNVFSKGAHSQIKQSMTHYQDQFGEISYERAENATKAQNWFVELGKLNQKRFNEKSQKGIWDYPKLINMHRALLDRYFEKGLAEIVRVRAGDKTIGYLYNFLFKGRVYYYMGGFVYHEDNKLRPGMVTHSEAIQHYAKQNDLEYYDFLAGNQSYKKRLSDDSSQMIHFTVTRPCFKYKLSDYLRKIKNFFKKKRPRKS